MGGDWFSFNLMPANRVHAARRRKRTVIAQCYCEVKGSGNVKPQTNARQRDKERQVYEIRGRKEKGEANKQIE